MMKIDVQKFLAAHRLTRSVAPIVARYLARSFPRDAKLKVAIYHSPNRISYSQIYPFLAYARALKDRYGIVIRCYPFDDLLRVTKQGKQPADIVILQPWFTLLPSDLNAACAAVKKRHPNAEVSFLDSFAHNDIRLARYLPDDLKYYVKKSLYKDRQVYLGAYRSDTPTLQYYGDIYDIQEPAVDFQTPPTVLDKLRLSPNFLTAPHFMRAFAQDTLPPWGGRNLDVQTRLGQKGGPVYKAMRQASIAAVDGIKGLKTSPKDRISYPAYMAEMCDARLCFSPFGFGELCWRDIEAFQAGAVLIKPDMSHLETLPNLYEPGVTYLPVSWDFSDLETVVRKALANPEMCCQIRETAWKRTVDYFAQSQFVEDVGFLFETSHCDPVSV